MDRLDTIQSLQADMTTSVKIKKNPPKGVRFLGTKVMTTEEWAAVESNKRQRNTQEHALVAEHLHKPHPIHMKVNAARLPDHRLVKLDGHTRAWIWIHGRKEPGDCGPPPEAVYVDIWSAPDLETTKALYKVFDNRGAVETTMDQVYGGSRDLNLEFNSELLRSNRFVAAIRHLDQMKNGLKSNTDIYDLLNEWKSELLKLDKCLPSRRKFTAGVVSAALLTFRMYDEKLAAEFWSAYQRDEGNKGSGLTDPVQALHERYLATTGGGRETREYMIRVALAAFEKYRSGKSYLRSGDIRPIKWTTVREMFNETELEKFKV